MISWDWKNNVSVSDSGKCKCGESVKETKEFNSIGGQPVDAIVITRECNDCGIKGVVNLERGPSGFDRI